MSERDADTESDQQERDQDQETEFGNPDAESDNEPRSIAGSLARGAWSLATFWPRFAVDVAHKGLDSAERIAVARLRKRLDASPDDAQVHHPEYRSDEDGDSQMSSAARAFARLLAAAGNQTAESASDRLNMRTVRQMVPDEARILAYLASGTSAPLMHLGSGPLVGPANQRWLDNLSTVGRDARVELRDRVPEYISNLRSMGLVESGDEDKSLLSTYQRMEVESIVLQTISEIEKKGQRPKFFRRVLRISASGKAFWAACGVTPTEIE